jgi:hypothetical protein
VAIDQSPAPNVPWFGARALARSLQAEVASLQAQCDEQREQLRQLGGLTLLELEERRRDLEAALRNQQAQLEQERARANVEIQGLLEQAQALRATIVRTEETALLQEAGVYAYRHPLSDAVAYQQALAGIELRVKEMTRKDGGAVLATTSWTVNGSVTEGRAMVRDFSKLLLRAFNAEADNLVRGLKPYRLTSALERLDKVATTIEKLGKTMAIRISPDYLLLRKRELEMTADFLQKQAEEKEAERVERERLREERKVQQEMERERARLEKERQHYENALQALLKKGDDAGAERLQAQLADVDRAIADVDYRAANIRAGYVYVISNIGSFGERMVKVGLTRRLDPQDRIRELSDASVPFNFDTHALFFSKDAVGIEQALHARLAAARVNVVNRRREFFRASPVEVKALLAELAGELLEFQEVPEALQYRQCLSQAASAQAAGVSA